MLHTMLSARLLFYEIYQSHDHPLPIDVQYHPVEPSGDIPHIDFPQKCTKLVILHNLSLKTPHSFYS